MNPPLPFQQFQRSLARHLRDPRGGQRPAGVPRRRAQLYRELVRNQLESVLLACFPVTQATLGHSRWHRLLAAFLRDVRCQSPFVRDIPREFLRWLLAEPLPLQLPPWARELAHYEWVELALDIMDTDTPAHDAKGDLLAGQVVLAPALMNLAYRWPVHRIGPDYRPRQPHPVNLLVFRNAADQINFIELNPVTARLIAWLQEGETGAGAGVKIAHELGHSDPAGILRHAADQLAELLAAGAILGVAPELTPLRGTA